MFNMLNIYNWFFKKKKMCTNIYCNKNDNFNIYLKKNLIIKNS